MEQTGIKPEQVRLSLPASDEDLAKLKPGTVVYLDGVIYTAREGVYQKVIAEGEALPLDLASITNANFHCSPAAAQRADGSYDIGGVTATASFRFSKWLPDWFKKTGTKILIGKGGLARDDYTGVMVEYGAVYLTTVGYGTGALLGRGIKRVKDVFWLNELGIAQAMWLFEVQNFGPLIVDSDLKGNSLFVQQGDLINKNLEKLYEGLGPPALQRFGETDDRTDEVI